MHRMKLPLSLLLCAASLSACAESEAPKVAAAAAAAATATTEAQADAAQAVDAAVTAPSVDLKDPNASLSNDPKDVAAVKALRTMEPRLNVDRVGPAPIPGWRELVVNGSTLYVSEDGRYLVQGSIFDMSTRKDLSQGGISEFRRAELSKVQQQDKIVFAPAGKPKHTVMVFTDIECGFCRKLHDDIAEYNRLGIAIEYLAFPRAGTASPDFKHMESVWCSADRNKALTDAKAGRPVAPKTCTNPVMMQYTLGQKVGLQGTPMIVAASGVALPGYMPPKDLLAALDRIADEAKSGGKAPGAR